MSEESASASRPPARELERLRAEVEELRRLNSVDDLLETLTGVLDIRQVFDRVSEISRAVLPHDAIALGRITPDRQSIRVWAHSAIPKGFDIPETVPLPDPTVVQREWDFMVLDDISADETLRRQNAPLLKYGVKSVLRIPLKEDGMIVAALNFLSFRPDAYAARDVLVAKRIAAFVHLALSHHDLAEAARRAAEAQERTRQLERRVEGLVAALAAHGRTSRVIGVSASWKDVLRQAAKVASAETTVLLTGESGTGKEVVARFVHSSSPRASGPFVAINCAALPDTLLESELFGFERGAFSGAHAAKPGRIEAAQGGVLFLDEVGETSPSVQAKLLRVLQEREFQRLGGSRPQRADVRVVAATNRDLGKDVETGHFRRDLYYRLRVIEIPIPPLRERPEDVLPLARALLLDAARRTGAKVTGFTPEAARLLQRHCWPGNVRELANAVERAAVLADGARVGAEDLPDEIVRPARGGGAEGETLAEVEKAHVLFVLGEEEGHREKAARRLGIGVATLYRKLKEWDESGR